MLRHEKFEGLVHEPCAGDGVMGDVLQDAGYDVRMSDLEPRRDDVAYGDALNIGRVANAVTNPPYCALKSLVPHWLETVDHKLALLVRLNFLEAQSRVPWLTGPNAPAKVIVVAGRMKVFGKTSQFPHAWVVWDRRTQHKTELVIDQATE